MMRWKKSNTKYILIDLLCLFKYSLASWANLAFDSSPCNLETPDSSILKTCTRGDSPITHKSFFNSSTERALASVSTLNLLTNLSFLRLSSTLTTASSFCLENYFLMNYMVEIKSYPSINAKRYLEDGSKARSITTTVAFGFSFSSSAFL
jgi:hypothetical protein